MKTLMEKWENTWNIQESQGIVEKKYNKSLQKSWKRYDESKKKYKKSSDMTGKMKKIQETVMKVREKSEKSQGKWSKFKKCPRKSGKSLKIKEIVWTMRETWRGKRINTQNHQESHRERIWNWRNHVEKEEQVKFSLTVFSIHYKFESSCAEIWPMHASLFNSRATRETFLSQILVIHVFE